MSINRFVNQLHTARKPVVETAATESIRFGEEAASDWPSDARTIVRVYDAKYKNVGDSTPYTTGRLIRGAGNKEYLVEVDGKHMLVKTTGIDNRSGYTALLGATMRPAETAAAIQSGNHKTESLLDALNQQNGARRIGAADRARYTRDVVRNMSAEQIQRKLEALRGKTDDASRSWVVIYTDALRQKQNGAETASAADMAALLQELDAVRETAGWFDKLTAKSKATYVKRFPNSKYAQRKAAAARSADAAANKKAIAEKIAGLDAERKSNLQAITAIARAPDADLRDPKKRKINQTRTATLVDRNAAILDEIKALRATLEATAKV